MRIEPINLLPTTMQLKTYADDKATVAIIDCVQAIEDKDDRLVEAQNACIEHFESFGQDNHDDHLVRVAEATQKTSSSMFEFKKQFNTGMTADSAKVMAKPLSQGFLSECNDRVRRIENDMAHFKTALQQLEASQSARALDTIGPSLKNDLASVRASMEACHARLAIVEAKHASFSPATVRSMLVKNGTDDADTSEDELRQPEIDIDPRLQLGTFVKTIADNHAAVIDAILPNGRSATIRWFVRAHGPYLRGRLKFPVDAKSKQLRAWWTQDWPMEDLMVWENAGGQICDAYRVVTDKRSKGGFGIRERKCAP